MDDISDDLELSYEDEGMKEREDSWTDIRMLSGRVIGFNWSRTGPANDILASCWSLSARGVCIDRTQLI